jgi:hypothetical protein
MQEPSTQDVRTNCSFARQYAEAAIESDLNRPGFTGGQNSRRIARYGTDTKEENLEAVFA